MSTDKAEHFAAAWRLLAPPSILPPEREFRFHPVRKWRFDFAWPSRFVAVEIEGNAWGVKGGGRHMQDGDMEKYNAAAALGWRVLRFSPGMLNRNPAGCVESVLGVLGERRPEPRRCPHGIPVNEDCPHCAEIDDRFDVGYER